jgi:hypothetical protein
VSVEIVLVKEKGAAPPLPVNPVDPVEPVEPEAPVDPFAIVPIVFP